MSTMRVPDTSDTILRPRLNPVLDMICQKKLTLVVAGPGYGKTTLVAQAMARLCLQAVWYRPDPVETDFLGFIRRLVRGIQGYYPGFWEGLGTQEGNENAFFQMDSAVAGEAFLTEMKAHVTSDLFLVVDDCQVLDSPPEINAFFQSLLDRLLPSFHLILISRVLVPLKLSRLMADRQVIQIAEAALAFTTKEIRLLFSQLFDIVLPEDYIDLLYRKTGGWVSGLVLFYHSLRKKTGPEVGDAITSLNGSQRYLFNYFMENVFDSLPEEKQAFMLRTAILSRLHFKFCNRFLSIDNARAILCELEDGHCFTFSVDEDRDLFFYHRLFQEFLQDKLKHWLDPEEINRLYKDAAILYEREDQGQEALQHHLLAGNIADASRLLNRFARPIIKQDRPQMVKSLLSIIPAQYMDEEPWFQYLEAGYLGLCRRLQLAANAYEKVLKVFRSQQDEQGECLCLMELAEYYLASGELKKSEQAYKKILAKDRLDPYLTIIAMGYLIRVLALFQKTSDADNYAQKAIALLVGLEDEASLKMAQGWIYVAQGYRYVFSGGYQKAMELGEDSKNLFEAVRQYRFLFSSYFLISYSCFYRGLFSKGMASAMEGLQIARGKGVYDEFSEFLRLLRAKNCLEMDTITQDQLDKAFDDCQKSLQSFAGSAFPGGVAQAYLVLHRAYLRKGDISGAEQSLRRGMEAIRVNDMPLIKNELQVALSQLLFFEKKKENEAMVLLRDAEQNLVYSGWHICWVSRIFARYYWERGHRERAFEYMVCGLKISEEESFDAWIVRESDWSVPLLVELLSMGTMKPYLQKILVTMGAKAQNPMMGLQNHKKPAIKKAVAEIMALMPRLPAPPISVCLFEQFRLFVGEKKIVANNWKSKKARTLFKYLVAMRHKGYLDKEILMELLWPDEDPQKSALRFHVAMAALRKTLEPCLSKGVRSSYILRSGQSYRIDIKENGSVDIESFVRQVALGRKAKDSETAMGHYQKAVILYQGDFLEEDLYEDWCAPERERYKQTYLEALKKVIEYHENKKNYADCIVAANTYLQNDRYAETIIRRLMKYYALTGNRPMITHIYEKFEQTIQIELNCGVSSKTKQLYTQLVSA
ncbi:MAG: hypothetical protein KKF12_17115 [Proteobacteria bacterium]|nr:hypothetical protein [Pseudomonadota bacterium]